MFRLVLICPIQRMFHAVPLDLQSRPIEYKDFQSATTMYCTKMAHVAIKSKPFHHAFGGFVLFFLCRVPDGTPYRLTCCYHDTARTLSSCTVLCKVASLSGRVAIFYSILTLRLVDFMVPQFLQEMGCRHDFDIVEGARCDIKGYDDEAGFGVFLAKCL